MYSYPIRSDELYHYGVLGMKWGKHRAARNAALEKTSAERANSSKFSRRYLHRVTQAAINKKDRYKANQEIANGKNPLIAHAKAYMKSSIKNTAVQAITATTVGVGVSVVTANPFLGVTAGSLASTAVSAGQYTKRMHNMVTNDKTKETIRAEKNARKDSKIRKKYGIDVTRDDQQRVTSIRTDNPNTRNIRRINKMQKRVNRRGTY